MTTELQQFMNEQFGTIRAVMVDDEPWFVAKDVCDCLGIQNTTQALQKVDDDERGMFNIGRQGDANIVSEPGLYGLVLSSRKSEAKLFKRWIKHEVLPTLRKHGAYMDGNVIEEAIANPDFGIKLLQSLKEEREKRQLLEQEVELNKPKVEFANAVRDSVEGIPISELAKVLNQHGINIGRNRLFEWLRGTGFLIRSGKSRNTPTQYSMDRELMTVREMTYKIPSTNEIMVSFQTLITGKGQQYFIDRFLGGTI